MKFESSTEQDIEQLQRWIDIDLYHKNLFVPTWWLTGAPGSLLSFRLDDSKGTVCYVRVNKYEHYCRLYIQFAPEQEVSKVRLVKALLKMIPMIAEYCKKQDVEGVIFESVSPTLIAFGKKVFGFQPVGGNDYMLQFQAGV